MQYLLAVTGSIASGKSYLCRKLQEEAEGRNLKVNVLSWDEYRKQALAERTRPEYRKLQEDLVSYFGPSIIEKGTINRRNLSELAFSNLKALSFLEGHLDEFILKELRNDLPKLQGITLIEIALFVEKDLPYLTNYNALLVHCSRDLQVQRLRNGDLPLEQVMKRIELQLTAEEKRKRILSTQQEKGSGDFYAFNSENSSQKDVAGLLDEIIVRAQR